MKPPSHLRALQALELTIKHGSLKEAAAQLGITPAAAGQRVRALEDYLGFDLLVRGRFGVQPSPALVAAMPDLKAAFEHLQSVAQTLDFQRVQEIHIISDPDWTDLWLLPRLAAFRKAHPNILFCVNGTGDVPMRPGQADCTVTLGGTAGDLLYRDYMWAIGSAENAARVAGRDDSDKLEGFPLVHLNCYNDDIGWPDLIEQHNLHRAEPANRGVRYLRVTQGLDAIRADVGFLLCGASLTMEVVENGIAQALFKPKQGAWSRRPYVAQFRQDALRRPQVTQLREWLVAEAAATQADLENYASEL